MPTYVCALVQKMQAVLIDRENARSVEGGGAAAVDVEEGGAEHGEGADQAFAQADKEENKSEHKLQMKCTRHQVGGTVPISGFSTPFVVKYNTSCISMYLYMLNLCL